MQRTAGHGHEHSRRGRRIRWASWLAAGLAASAVAAAGTPPAFAEAPEFGRCVAQAGGHFENAACTKAAKVGTEKFEWLAGVVKTHFTTKIKPESALTIEVVGGNKYTCKGEESDGEIAGPKLVRNVTVSLKGCGYLGSACQNAAAEEIITAPLEGVLGVEKVSSEGPLKNKLALELHAPAGQDFADYTCAGLPDNVRGAILHEITANTMLTKAEEKYVSTKGEQKPSMFAGEPDDSRILESNLNGGPFEEMGWTMTEIANYEEKIEASTVN